MADELLRFDSVAEVLQEYAAWAAGRYKANLAASGRNASGALSRSVRAFVVSGERWYEVRMSMEEYWKYAENGTRPHWPPVDAIRRWVEIKPVIPRPDSRGRIPTPKQLAYLIARKISRVGTRGIPDLGEAEEAAWERFRERLEAALAEDAASYITRVLHNNSGVKKNI